ncbi:Dolichyl-diphosphooligosaccharide--protein glycosyltransferase 48 kDa subunit [Vitis vinifera]|uniref:Dolichyl-diphosphooligosaccharide--protein glycosyltransferase 48 kDa subunit n=1 Tax=Vitis vinifera TaxID=29760 RepID=A0A438EL55_VITVI|nr:Dolichyl-diphosphooligosaccharide--protein glycosyltransferase 48 kDa subunit [Vitis vinifera]
MERVEAFFLRLQGRVERAEEFPMRVVWNAMALIKAGMGRFSVKGFNIGQAAREGMVFSESKDCLGDVKFGKKIDLGMTWFFCGKEAKEGVKGYPVLHFWSLWKGRNQRAVESKGMLDQIIKSSFLGNLLLWARNNARVLISGSLSMFSNRLFRSGVQKAGSSTKHEKSGNEQFLTELSRWVFHERGHLKAVNVSHHNVGEADEPSMYRIKDDLEYSVEIYEWSGTSWEPYVAEDVQVQFYMMSPYVLKTLSTNQKGLYYTAFKVPDVYGVFQFKVEYQRLGYTSLSLSKQIPVRPFRHNEYERFITAAFPYYGSSFTMCGDGVVSGI